MQEDEISRWLFNPVPPGLWHVIYYHGEKKYPCPGGIGLSNVQE